MLEKQDDSNSSRVATWNEYIAETWQKYLPPIRPATEELEVFERFLEREIQKKETDLNVLILGSTPELRDLVLAYHLTPTIVDYNEANYKMLTTLMKEKGEEVFINQNWLDMNVGETFDVILSEASLTVIPCKTANQFFEKVRTHLKPDGIVVAKIWIRLSDQRPDITTLLSDYRQKMPHRDFYSVICLPLYHHFYDYEREVVSVKYMSIQMEELHRKGVLKDSEWETINRHEYENVTLELYIPHIDDLKQLINRYFSITEILSADFDYSEYHPIFVLKPHTKTS